MKIPIVDKDDQVIGYKERDEVDFSADIFRTASLWITNNKGDVLLAQRKNTKRVDPGKWAEAIGGTVEGKDSYLDTIVREAEEELGLREIGEEEGPQAVYYDARLIFCPMVYGCARSTGRGLYNPARRSRASSLDSSCRTGKRT